MRPHPDFPGGGQDCCKLNPGCDLAAYSDRPVRMPDERLPYGRQWIDDDDVAAVVACLRGDWLTQGPAVEQFEAAICAATGAAHAVAVSSGTAALHLAALATGVGPGDTGITAAMTFVASANCIAYGGGRPYFADIDPATGLIDLNALEDRARQLAAAGQPPKVIVPVDFAGQPADLPAVRVIADRYGAMVIEDAAHALGAEYEAEDKRFRVGGWGHADMAVLSFHPVKHITTAEGGAVLTADARLASRVRDLRSHGIHRDLARLTRPDEGPWYYEQADLGFNYRLSDVQCALGVSQMLKLDHFVARRQEIARAYDEAFRRPPLAGWLSPLAHARHSAAHAYHLYVGRLVPRPGETNADIAVRRRTLFLALRDRGIAAQVHYIPVPMQPYYRDTFGERLEAYSGASAYYAGCITVPLFPRMTDADVARVVAALTDIAGCE